MFYQVFLSSKVKRSVMISNKLGKYELPHKLTNDLRSKEIKKYDKNLKTS